MPQRGNETFDPFIFVIVFINQPDYAENQRISMKVRISAIRGYSNMRPPFFILSAICGFNHSVSPDPISIGAIFL